MTQKDPKLFPQQCINFMQPMFSPKKHKTLHLHHKTKIALFLQRKGPTISKMDIYFCPFFWSEPISFSDFYRRLWDIEGSHIGWVP
jgi:hypothetical protein